MHERTIKHYKELEWNFKQVVIYINRMKFNYKQKEKFWLWYYKNLNNELINVLEVLKWTENNI